jgi:hypothetical protein
MPSVRELLRQRDPKFAAALDMQVAAAELDIRRMRCACCDQQDEVAWCPAWARALCVDCREHWSEDELSGAPRLVLQGEPSVWLSCCPPERGSED